MYILTPCGPKPYCCNNILQYLVELQYIADHVMLWALLLRTARHLSELHLEVAMLVNRYFTIPEICLQFGNPAEQQVISGAQSDRMPV